VGWPAAKDTVGVLVVAGTVALSIAVCAGWISTDPKLATVQGTVLGFILNEAKIILSSYFNTDKESAP
jgi:hypothetical protein